MKHKVYPSAIMVFFAAVGLILLGGGIQSTFDYENYYNHYIGTYYYLDLDYGYKWLQSFMSHIGIGYEDFRLLIIAMFVIVFTMIAYRYIREKVLVVILLYLFYCFPFDLVNLRNTIANAILYIAFFHAVNNKNRSRLYVPI